MEDHNRCKADLATARRPIYLPDAAVCSTIKLAAPLIARALDVSDSSLYAAPARHRSLLQNLTPESTDPASIEPKF